MNLGHIGRPLTVCIGVEKVTFGRWTRAVWLDLTAYAKRVLPNPLDEAAKVLERVTGVDAATIRRLCIEDQLEIKAAEKENRPPVQLATTYKQAADGLMERALEKASSYLTPGSAEMRTFIGSVEGGSQLFWLLLKQHHPEITVDDAYDVLGYVSQKAAFVEDGERDEKGNPVPITADFIYATAQGILPEKLKNGASPVGSKPPGNQHSSTSTGSPSISE